MSSSPARAGAEFRRASSRVIASATARPKRARTNGPRPIFPSFGWIAFDATVPICPDDRYVRVAVGFDAQDGAMIRSAHSGGEEKIEAAVRVEQAGAQSQA